MGGGYFGIFGDTEMFDRVVRGGAKRGSFERLTMSCLGTWKQMGSGCLIPNERKKGGGGGDV